MHQISPHTTLVEEIALMIHLAALDFFGAITDGTSASSMEKSSHTHCNSTSHNILNRPFLDGGFHLTLEVWVVLNSVVGSRTVRIRVGSNSPIRF